MNLKYTISVNKDTNKIVSSSEDRFVGISFGNLIRIGNDSTLYTISGKDSFFFIKDFAVENPRVIVLDEEIGFNLQKDDTLKITYKEYEAKFISDIINKGDNYIPEDNIEVLGGILSVDIASGIGIPTILEVIEISNNGSIEKIGIKNKGKYLIPPDNSIITRGKRGDGLIIEIKYMELSNRTVIERTIDNISFLDGKTYIVLDYSLPPNLKNGKLSCEKSTLLLSSNYIGESQKNAYYQIFRDFTPNLRLPLMLRGSLSPDVVYNKSCLIIDEELGKIKKQLGIK